MKPTKLQQKVIDKAKEELKFVHGYEDEICLNVLPCDSDIEKDFDSSVSLLVTESIVFRYGDSDDAEELYY